ncbi:esterase-like activity of phytase family protein [Kordiimonas sp. SCSIO 12610]|uniref:esterase-like activity of phytase family protein n=1 Tax=Kordiimonas sp. SCSIO 12610 TaxID=2829597 RepID=UPI00210F1178|nr:esterase-like activity of phytase family protein [Kordiimonas sp. SCSIO 12610]UTW55402.1 esterase-like activity of phytase family protein [Kordiimonas sp. SCSIO 12610]
MQHSFKLPVRLLSILTAIVVSSVTVTADEKKPEWGGQKHKITAQPLALNEDNPKQLSVGKLRFLNGWALTSDHKQFGGLSALRVFETDASDVFKIFSITDTGLWLRADLDLNAKAPFTNATLRWQSPKSEGRDGKAKQDSESIVKVDDGWLIGFEQDHRILHVTAPAKNTRRSKITDQIDFSGVGKNGGVEAMTLMPNGEILAFMENGRDRQGRYKAFLATETTSKLLHFKPAPNFHATDATTLSNGDVLVMTRFFSPIDGVAAKLVRIKVADIVEGSTLSGEELATFRPPLTVDNMEGLDVVELPDGRTLVFMLSDDNFSFLQRTIMMVFELTDQ